MTDEREAAAAAAEVANGPTITQLRRLMSARAAHESADTAAKAAKRRLTNLENEIHEALEGAGIKGEYKRDLGDPYGTVGFTAGETEYSKVYDDYAFEEWVKSHGYEETLLGERKPRKKALNQLLRRKKTAGESFPDGTELSRTTRVTVRNK